MKIVRIVVFCLVYGAAGIHNIEDHHPDNLCGGLWARQGPSSLDMRPAA